MLAAAKQKQCKSAAAIAAKVQQKFAVKVTVSSVQRALNKEGLKHLRHKVVPLLTAQQRQARINGTAAHRSDTVCWRDTTITDRMHAMGKPAGTMLQLIRQRKMYNASMPMSQDGFSWNGLPTHLVCLTLKISGLGATIG